VIGEGYRWHFKFTGFLDQVFDPTRSVQEAVFGVNMQMHKLCHHLLPPPESAILEGLPTQIIGRARGMEEQKIGANLASLSHFCALDLTLLPQFTLSSLSAKLWCGFGSVVREEAMFL